MQPKPSLLTRDLVLDDNTYTNKTWAEVSGISVQEIHIMEVEFLSNMRYTLYASEAEWKAWHVKLGKFWKYFDNASKAPTESLLRNLGPLPSPRGLPNLPSPPASTHTSPPYLNNYNSSAPNIVSSHRLSMPPYVSSNSSPPIKPLPDITLRPTTRKRSRDHSQEIHEPCTKRYAPSVPTSTHSSAALTPGNSSSLASVSSTTSSTGNYSNNSGPKLPMPNLTISTGKHYTERRSSPPTQLPMPPALSRSTALPGMNRWPQNGSLPSLHQNAPLNLQPNDNISPLSERAARQPPFTTNSSTPSPTSFSFPQSAHTPNHLSPASFPLPRSSPYKPVRHVHTLLVPPPSASMHDPPQNLSYSQMHYQPLGKPISQRRPGVLPTLQQESWGQTHNMPVFLPQPKVSN